MLIIELLCICGRVIHLCFHARGLKDMDGLMHEGWILNSILYSAFKKNVKLEIEMGSRKGVTDTVSGANDLIG